MVGVRRLVAAVVLALLAAGCDSPFQFSPQQAQPTGMAVVFIRDPDGPRRLAILSEDWFYCYPPTRELYLAPRGYVTDFTSIPPAAKGLIDEVGRNLEAAVIHDWLYAVGEAGGREKADRIFRYALMEQGVGVVTRNAMFRAVRLGGGAAYGRPNEFQRFGDPRTGRLGRPPVRKPARAAVARLNSCEELEDLERLAQLRARFSSANWPRADTRD